MDILYHRQKLKLVMLAAVLLYYLLLKERRQARRHARAKRLRKKQGLFANFLYFIRHNDTNKIYRYTRMSKQQFDYILKLLQRFWAKKKTVSTIQPAHRLLITLHYLAKGCSMSQMAIEHKVGIATISQVIKETTKALWEVLSPIYLKTPTVEGWKNVSLGFFNKWNMPNCIGAIDGIHINIKTPSQKMCHSIVLMASCDSFHKFTLIDTGITGSKHESVVLRESGFGRRILNNQLELPSDSILPNSDILFPHYFTADHAFPLNHRIMKPYADQKLTEDKLIFNCRLTRARRTIKYTLGMLVQRWRVLRTVIIADVETGEYIALAAVVLHNFLLCCVQPQNRKYCATGVAAASTLRTVSRLSSYNENRRVQEKRDILCNYLNSKAGSLPW